MAFEEISRNTTIPTVGGKKIDDAVVVSTINGTVFNGWKSVSITKNIDTMAHGFSMEIFDSFLPLKKNWPLKPGVKVKISIGKERVITGFIDVLDIGFDATSRTFTVSGRSAPSDLIDCSHVGDTEFTNISLEELAKQLVAPFGLKVFLSVVPETIDKFAIKPGETVFEALDRAARLQGFFWISTRGGNIRLTRAARVRAFSQIAQGFNLTGASLSIDNSARFSEYSVKGQSAGGDEIPGLTAAQPEGSAKDGGITRFRPLLIIAEGAVDTAKATKRAQWEMSNRIAQGFQVSATVDSWLQEDGSLWGINQLVRFNSQFIGVKSNLLIAGIEQTKSFSGGTSTNFTLVPKNSFDPQPEANAGGDELLEQLGAT